MQNEKNRKKLEEALSLKKITKTFLGGKIIANDDITISFFKNEIHSIVGENGSGKSTLMNIIFGLYKQDYGHIYVNGHKTNMYQKGASKKNKIGMVHQHFHLVENFTVLDNVILGQEEIVVNHKTHKKLKTYKTDLKKIRKQIDSFIKENSFKKEFAFYKNIFHLFEETKHKKTKQKNLIFEEKNKRSRIPQKNSGVNKKYLAMSDWIRSRKIEIEDIELVQDRLNLILENNKDPKVKEAIELIKSEDKILNDIYSYNEKLVSRFGVVKRKNVLKRLLYIQDKYHIEIDPFAKISNLSIGQRQMVEILKVLWDDKDIIIFDEPTATLSIIEIEKLLKTINHLKKEGKTIIFISHKLQEVKTISDRISVLRKGVLINTYENTNSLKPTQIGKDMVGRVINLNYPRKKENIGLDTLVVNNLTYRTSSGFKALDNVSFAVREGEIFGIAGIEGNGQEEIIKILTNLRKPYDGLVRYKGQILTDKKGYKWNSKKRRKKMSHVPIDRLKHGLVPNMDLQFNSKISDFDTKFFKKNKLDIFTSKIINEMRVDGAFSHKVQVKNLSGGNQQKFVFGREIYRDHEIIIAGHPTRGLDISAIDNIYKKLIANAKGKTTILYSLEISELVAVCDRMAVMYKGKIISIVDPRKVTMEEISKMMIGEYK